MTSTPIFDSTRIPRRARPRSGRAAVPRRIGPRRLFVLSVLLTALLGGVGPLSAQNPLLQQVQDQAAASRALLNPDALRVFVCGSASPLGAEPTPEQACIAVLAGGHLFLVDVGDGANTNLQLGNLPMNALRTVFLTHFHSDHIASIPDVNLGSWVAGRPRPLEVAGPKGVATVVEGLNLAYEQDRRYRVAHHGEDLLPPALGVMVARTLEPGVVFEQDGVKVTAFEVDHEPVDPAFGYRFDYGGRSVVISGDTVRSESLTAAVQGVDLLLHDAMAQQVVRMLQGARAQIPGDRVAKILADIQTYHAPVEDVAALAREAGVRQLALYHLVPATGNPMVMAQFQAAGPNVIVVRDGQLFELPTDSEEITHRMLFER